MEKEKDVLENIVDTISNSVKGVAKDKNIINAVIGAIAGHEIAKRTSLYKSKELLAIVGGLLGYTIKKDDNTKKTVKEGEFEEIESEDEDE